MKPRTTLSKENAIITFSLGNYTEVKNVYGFPNVTGDSVSNSYQVIDLHDTFTSSPGSSSGAKIGVSRVASLEHREDPDNTFGNTDDKYRVHLF